MVWSKADIESILREPDRTTTYTDGTSICYWIVCHNVNLYISYDEYQNVICAIWYTISGNKTLFAKHTTLEKILEILPEDWQNIVIFNLNMFSIFSDSR